MKTLVYSLIHKLLYISVVLQALILDKQPNILTQRSRQIIDHYWQNVNP